MTDNRNPAAWLAVAADGSENSAVYALKEQADAAARAWGWMIVPLYPFPALWPEDEIAIEAAWERTGLEPTWPADEPQTGVRCANAMADEITRLRLTIAEHEALRHLCHHAKWCDQCDDLDAAEASTVEGFLRRLSERHE